MMTLPIDDCQSFTPLRKLTLALHRLLSPQALVTLTEEVLTSWSRFDRHHATSTNEGSDLMYIGHW